MSDWLRAYLSGRIHWRYLVASPGINDDLQTWLDAQGRQGWELVGYERGTYVFKRGNG